MSYIPTIWADGDLITAQKLNKLETGLSNIGNTVDKDTIALEFNPSNTYTAGQYVYKEGVLYRFTADHAAGAWMGSDAETVTVGGEVCALKADLSELDADAINDRLDLTTEAHPNKQVVDIGSFTPRAGSTDWNYYNVTFPFPGDGVYYNNPILQSKSPYGTTFTFLDDNGNNIVITNASGSEVSNIANSQYDAIKIDGLNVTRILYSYYNNLINNNPRATQQFTLASLPTTIKIGYVYTFVSKTADPSEAIFGMTKDAWYDEYKPYGGYDYTCASGLINAVDNIVNTANGNVISSIYDSTASYSIGDYVLYEGKIYKCTTAIATAESWNVNHWEEILLTDEFGDINDDLQMVVEEKETLPEPTTGVQCANPSKIRVVPVGKYYYYYLDWVDISRDGVYYKNPHSGPNATWLYDVRFYNEYGESLTGKNPDGTEITSLTVFSAENSWMTVSENGRRVETFTNGSRGNNLRFDCKVAFIKGCYRNNSSNVSYGVTYGEHSDTYVSYDGDQSPTTLEKTYSTDIAKFVLNYMRIYGALVDNGIYDITYPEKSNTAFAKAVRYYMQRFDRERKNIIRFGSFNKFVSRGSGNWPDIKKELADYAIDICGFQECAPIVSDGVVTNEIGAYLQSYQFGGYVPQNATVDKALVTHWNLDSSDNLTILTYDGGVSTCVRGIFSLRPHLWYSNAIDSDVTISVYSCHLSSSGKTIDGTSYGGLATRKKEIEGLLAIIAEDTSDFIVVVSDTNAFEPGFDIPSGTHQEWEMFRQAGLTPALPGYESTVTADLQDRYFCLADDGKVYCIAAYDQVFFSANISVDDYGIVDSNLYKMESNPSLVISDHCMIYADLKFDFEAVMQDKLKEIAVTEPWW